jgi:uncharacterized alpha-E superfamily protein
MLSSTAEHLYWMARSMERAENTARMLDVTYRMSLLKNTIPEAVDQEWIAVLNISGLYSLYSEHHPLVSAVEVIDFMAFDEANPSSIFNSLRLARDNCRTVRGTVTSEMWETLNATWLEMKKLKQNGVRKDGVSDFFDWVKERSHLFRGITYGTMLHDDAFRFIRLGTFLERADNTARILDVKYHVLLPSLQDVGGAADYYQWGALLRSVSAFETYRKAYRDLITPKRVTELLILRADMPRSLHACVQEVDEQGSIINGPRSGELLRLTGMLRAELRFGRIEDIIDQGLHEYLTRFLTRIHAIGDQINSTYFWPSDD